MRKTPPKPPVAKTPSTPVAKASKASIPSQAVTLAPGSAGRGDLPDVKVWLALLNPQHPHHASAVGYWEQAAAPRIFLCRITMLGLLRLSTNKVVMGGAPYTVAQAWAALQAVTALPEIGFQTEAEGIDAAMRQFTSQPKFRVTDWTDAYIAALAQRAGLRVVTFDRGFAQFAGLGLLTL